MRATMRIAAVSFTLVAFPAIAQRAPTDVELAQIGQALSAAGFTRWGSVELIEGSWEIEEATRGPQSCDVTLDARSYSVIEEDCE